MAYEDRLKELGLAQTCSGKALTAVYSYLLGTEQTRGSSQRGTADRQDVSDTSANKGC